MATNTNSNPNNNSQGQLDLNSIYGLDACNGNCGVSNTISPQYTRPSIEQIASYAGNAPQTESPNPTQNQIQFSDSSPISGDPSQMYQPITQQMANEYPTPAVVRAENQAIENMENNMNNNSANNTMAGNTTPIEAMSSNEALARSTASAITDFSNPYPVTRESLQYLNGFIRTQIGRRVTIDFLIGSNTIQSRSGYLLAVAANYILINELDTNDVTACDFYNIKFIRFYY